MFSSSSLELFEKTKTDFNGYSSHFDAAKDRYAAQVRTVKQLIYDFTETSINKEKHANKKVFFTN